jgi:VIT1/CCC1 family predicted Fe2+/Mn2+ transporter
MKHSLRTGIAFGLTSATITTLGLMMGLDAGTHSKIAVLGGILTIAVADAFSDALGIHISEESKSAKQKEVWESTIATFFSKFIFALTFAVPFFFFPLDTAIWIAIAWGLAILSVLSYIVARSQGEPAAQVVFEHLFIAVLVIFVSYEVGNLISRNIIFTN